MTTTNKIRIAFIKFGGLAMGGTELRLQLMALNLPRSLFEVDYYYCDAAPFLGTRSKPLNTDSSRREYLKSQGLNLIKFKVGAVDFRKPTHDWIDTDFWEIFNPTNYDLVQTGKAGPAEYPYYLLGLPVVELVALDEEPDHSPNIAWTVQPSTWQRARWCRKGGNASRSSVIPNPSNAPQSSDNFRESLGIAPDAVVAGMIQRNDPRIFSPIPLQAFSRVYHPDRHFVIMNGADAYRKQASKMKNVHFIPSSPLSETVSKFFNTLDIFAHGRKDGETYGTIFSEAIMHGKPCLSHYAPGGANASPETMGPCGWFAKDFNDYQQKLDTLFSDRAARMKLARKTKVMAEDYYSVDSGMIELQNVYFKICGRPELVQPERRIDYGLSDLGFLIAGNLADPASYAHHILNENASYDFALGITAIFMGRLKSYLELGAETGLFGFYIAHQNWLEQNITLQEEDSNHRAHLQRSIWLNNWDDRVSLTPTPFDSADLPPFDFLRVGRGSVLAFDRARAFVKARETKAIVMIELKSADDYPPDFGKNYRWWLCANNGRLYSYGKKSPETGMHYVGIPTERVGEFRDRLVEASRNYLMNRVGSSIKYVFVRGFSVVGSAMRGVLKLARLPYAALQRKHLTRKSS